MAFPEDDYVLLLGRVTYAVSSLEWKVLGFLPSSPELPESLQLAALNGRSTGGIGRNLRDERLLAQVADETLRNWLRRSGEILCDIALKRNAVIHARPATDDDRQRLHRWDLERREFFTITPSFLEELLAEIDELGREINRTRPRREAEADTSTTAI